MRKEQKALEEERQEIAQRREEYQRELKEWEEGLETVRVRNGKSCGELKDLLKRKKYYKKCVEIKKNTVGHPQPAPIFQNIRNKRNKPFKQLMIFLLGNNPKCSWKKIFLVGVSTKM